MLLRLRILEHEADGLCLYLKLESMQATNSFKIRGVANQFQAHGVGTKPHQSFVTMSAGRCQLVYDRTGSARPVR